MKIVKHTINTCCGTTSIIYKISKIIDANLLKSLVNLGFREATHFTSAGILYVDNSLFVITGPFGSDRLQVKCRKNDCTQKLDELEKLLTVLE